MLELEPMGIRARAKAGAKVRAEARARAKATATAKDNCELKLKLETTKAMAKATEAKATANKAKPKPRTCRQGLSVGWGWFIIPTHTPNPDYGCFGVGAGSPSLCAGNAFVVRVVHKLEVVDMDVHGMRSLRMKYDQGQKKVKTEVASVDKSYRMMPNPSLARGGTPSHAH